MSLPYGLKISFYDDFRGCEFIEKINGMYVDVYAIMSDSYDGNPDKCKILLRPLSDLTKEIEHKGEKFVPIVGLTEIAFEGEEIDTNRVKLSFEDDMYIVKINELEFGFDITDNSFVSYLYSLTSYVPSQLLLFQKLIEWHFDIADLISKGEAIDVNTLEIYPYK